MARLDMMPEGNTTSRISAGTVIKGEIISPNDIRIDCVFEGKLMVKGKVVVGESATIKGLAIFSREKCHFPFYRNKLTFLFYKMISQ